MILEVQAIVKKGVREEKIGLRCPILSGMLFAVYDSTWEQQSIENAREYKNEPLN